jgi:hypothetical protein
VLGVIHYVGTLKEILQLDYVPFLYPLCYFVIIGSKMGLTIEETLLTKEMMLISLQILGICCMNLMNLLFFPHKFNMCFSRMNPRHHVGRLSFTRSLEVDELW